MGTLWEAINQGTTLRCRGDANPLKSHHHIVTSDLQKKPAEKKATYSSRCGYQFHRHFLPDSSHSFGWSHICAVFVFLNLWYNTCVIAPLWRNAHARIHCREDLESWTKENGTANPHPLQVKDEAARRAKTRHFSIIDLGGRGGSRFFIYFVHDCNLGQKKKTTTTNPHPPQIKGEAARRARTRHFPILDLDGEGGSRFSIYFVQDCRLLLFFLQVS